MSFLDFYFFFFWKQIDILICLFLLIYQAKNLRLEPNMKINAKNAKKKYPANKFEIECFCSLEKLIIYVNPPFSW